MKRVLQTYVEQFLYIILLLTFLSGLTLCIVLAQSNHRLTNQVSFLQSQIQKNEDTAKQLKVLAEENKTLNEQSRQQAACFVRGFAFYTQTGSPVTLEEIAKCDFSTTDNTGGQSASVPTSHQSSSVVSGGEASSSSQFAPKQDNKQPNNPPSVLQRILSVPRGIIKFVTP